MTQECASARLQVVLADLQPDHPQPHISLRPHPWRRLKTQGSERIVPLVGVSLWAARRAVAAASHYFLFPRYYDETRCKGNSASAALNKWMSPRVPSGCVLHSFRHSFRERLRAAECAPDIIDRLGGWAVERVGETYWTGHPIEVLSQWAAAMIEGSGPHLRGLSPEPLS